MRPQVVSAIARGEFEERASSLRVARAIFDRVMPTWRTEARRGVSALANPHCTATHLGGWRPLSSIFRAAADPRDAVEMRLWQRRGRLRPAKRSARPRGSV